MTKLSIFGIVDEGNAKLINIVGMGEGDNEKWLREYLKRQGEVGRKKEADRKKWAERKKKKEEEALLREGAEVPLLSRRLVREKKGFIELDDPEIHPLCKDIFDLWKGVADQDHVEMKVVHHGILKVNRILKRISRSVDEQEDISPHKKELEAEIIALVRLLNMHKKLNPANTRIFEFIEAHINRLTNVTESNVKLS